MGQWTVILTQMSDFSLISWEGLTIIYLVSQTSTHWFEALSGRISQLRGRPSLLLLFPCLHNPVLDCDTHQPSEFGYELFIILGRTGGEEASLASVCLSLESRYHNSSLMRRLSSGWDSCPQCPMDGLLQTRRQGRQPCLNR